MARRLSTASIASLVVFLLLLGAAVLSSLRYEGPPVTAVSAWPAFDLQGHRGARGLMPENSLPGFEAALALGVTTLEMDVGVSRDGVLVVHHDRRIDPVRTRNPDGSWFAGAPPALTDLTLAELQAFDLGRVDPESEAAGRFAEQRGLDGVAMPTLEAVLRRAEALSGGAVRYNIETKISPLAPEESPDPETMAEIMVALLRETGTAERATIQSFDWRSLQAVQALDPDIVTVYLTAERDWLDNLGRGRDGVSPWTAGFDIDAFEGSIAEMIKAAGGAVWSPYYRDLRAPDLREARNLGLRVVPWTVNRPADMASLIDLGVDGIITDYPDRLRAVMAGKGLALPPAYAAASAPD